MKRLATDISIVRSVAQLKAQGEALIQQSQQA